ncbi:MAG TPA: DNA polymerase II large subunit [Candidatus Nanoarchaeia archaeon]|nr:DNA polymerase II large subunit [Candidatus Nanoarchaeia archaeon]
MKDIASAGIQNYFLSINTEIERCYTLAGEARKKGLDPEKEVNIPLAKNMAERVVGLISVVAPQLTNTTLTDSILELEKKYGMLDWRVGFSIAVEVAKEKFCQFSTKLEAMEVGIRVGFAYLTLGIVSAPLEGFTGLKIKKRKDGKEYFALQYAGPIRGAGGTAASTSVILADYVRVKMGYFPYDPDESEINRNNCEVHDYHERVTNLQYHPSNEELKFMIRHLPVEVDGDPTEQREVSNYKDLPRIETNLIRGGVALVLAEGLCQKAPKLWKRLSKWGKEFDLEWGFLDEFIKLKEKIHAEHQKTSSPDAQESGIKKVKPNNTFIMDLVAGRPILTHPLAEGGFRLRYGRTRMTGFSAAAIHPFTQIVLQKFIAIGTQLKVERPGKAATISCCDCIDPPIILLENGNVVKLTSEEQALKLLPEIKEIIYLGDILFNYGDFSENGQDLVPAGYCPEWWALEVAVALQNLSKESQISLSPERLQELIEHPLSTTPSLEEAVIISQETNTYLHPEYTFFWKLVPIEQLEKLLSWLQEGKVKVDSNHEIAKIVLPFSFHNQNQISAKRCLELLGIPHQVINKESVVLDKTEARIIALHFSFKNQQELLQVRFPRPSEQKIEHGLDLINVISPIKIRDKAGTFIGARMGRPEKAKMRAMTGSPQVMFPVGDEGDRLRSFQSALQHKEVRSMFPSWFCVSCNKEMVYPSCEECGKDCIQRYHCRFCGDLEKDVCRHGPAQKYKSLSLDINYYFQKALDRIKEKTYPDLIKGIRGTSNKNHVVEHLSKGILRAKHNIYVNKDGTTRYDGTEMPITHFKPKEIKTSLEKLKELGYTKDISGQELTSSSQLLELKPQDIILPGYNSLDESAPQVLSRVAHFIDDLLVKFYGVESFYNITKEEDLIGHLVIGLAPHISAGLIGRIIGFSETQALLASPMYHAGLRRDCFSSNTYIPLFIHDRWKIVTIGAFVNALHPVTIVDSYGTKEIKVSGVKTIGSDGRMVKVNNFTKHSPQPMIHLKTKLGRALTITSNHTQIIFIDGQKKDVKAKDLKIGDCLATPYHTKFPHQDIPSLDLLDLLSDQEWVMVRGVNSHEPNIKNYAREYFLKKEFDNYTRRDSYPILFIHKLRKQGLLSKCHLFRLAAKRDTVELPSVIPVDESFLKIVGLYVAEGYSRKVESSTAENSGKGLYQVYIAAENNEIRKFIGKTMKALFGLKTSENKQDRMTYSSHILYYLFITILKCGSSAYEKRMPDIFLNLPLEKQGYLLSGYFEGDGSVSQGDLRASFDTVSQGLLKDIDFMFSQMGIFVKNYTYTKLPGEKLKEFYRKKSREIPQFTITKGTIQSIFMPTFFKYITFISSRKQKIAQYLASKKGKARVNQKYDQNYVYDEITSIEGGPDEESYCLNVDGHEVVANSLLTRQCDGDEACVMLLLDALLNFSRSYLPERRGAKTMDSPLVLTGVLYPSEVDDQVHGLDVAWKYPLEFYLAALEMKKPWEVKVDGKKIEQLSDRLNTPLQYENFGFTHPVEDFNKGVQCSAYKTLPSMEEKIIGQMEIAQKVRAVDMDDVAKLIIQKHLLKDIKGNLRKFSMQQFRCVGCNEKYRRPPLVGKCVSCGGKIIFTITEGSVVKYLSHSMMLAKRYDFSPYLKQTLEILHHDIDTVFGKDKEKQVGLAGFLA